MSYLVAIEGRADRKMLAYSFPHVFAKDDYKEIGICWAKNGELDRAVGVKNIRVLTELLKCKYDGAICYVNDPDDDYERDYFSPHIINDQFAFASCGHLFETAHKKVGNNYAFLDQVLAPISKNYPTFFGTPAFQWLIEHIARSFVGIAFLENTGEIRLAHERLFTKTKLGYKYMNFEKAKKDAIESANKRKKWKN